MNNDPFKEEGRIENQLYDQKKFSVVSNFRSSINKMTLKPLEVLIPDEESVISNDSSNLSSSKISPHSIFKKETKKKNRETIHAFFEEKNKRKDSYKENDTDIDIILNKNALSTDMNKDEKKSNFQTLIKENKEGEVKDKKEKKKIFLNQIGKNFKTIMEEKDIEKSESKKQNENDIKIIDKKNKSAMNFEKNTSFTSITKNNKSVILKHKKKNRHTRKKTPKKSSGKFKSCPFLVTENLDLLKDSKIGELTENDFVLLDRFLEPLYKIVFREIKSFITKLLIIILPFICIKFEIKKMEWDLSGPFVLIFLLSLLMTINNNENEYFFVLAFILLFSGSFFVTLNAKMLYCQCSFIQILNIFCFCMFPIFLSDIFIFFFQLKDKFIIIIFLLIAFLWSLFGLCRFLLGISPKKKGFLVIYPAFVTYLFVTYLNCWTYQKKYFN